MDILGILNFALSVLIGLMVLVVLVVLHELGHAIVARRNGVVVEEFGIGFPPFAWGKKVKNSILGKNVLYSVNWLPLGGFVKLQGEHDEADAPGDYGKASLWKKTKILLAGVVMNWLTAILLLSILAVIGLPKVIDGQFTVASDTAVDKQPVKVAMVSEGLPADKSGLQVGDEVVSLAGRSLEEAKDLTELSKANAGKTVQLTYKRDGVVKTVPVSLRGENTDGQGFLGLAGVQQITYRSTWSAPIVGVALTGQFTASTLSSLGDMAYKFGTGLIQKISWNNSTRERGDAKLGQVGDSVGGPVAILGIIFPSAREAGLTSLMFTAALISLTLAVMNALPIPALDGGRLFVTLLYRKVLRRPLTKEKEEKIHGTGMMVLLFLVALVTIADIGKLL